LQLTDPRNEVLRCPEIAFLQLTDSQNEILRCPASALNIYKELEGLT